MASKGISQHSTSELVANKIFAMNERLDSIVQLAHSLEVQSKAMVCEDALERDMNKIVASPVASSHQMLTSTPLRTKLMKKTPAWNSLTPSEQVEVLHEVANEHTKVSLDYEGLRRSIVATQKVVALQNAFQLVRATGEEQSNEEQEYVLDLMDSNVEATKTLSDLMEEYTAAQVKSLELKTELASEWSQLRHFYASHFADDNNDENSAASANGTTPATSRSSTSVVDKKRAVLLEDEKKCEQMKMLTQKLMMAFPNLNIDLLPSSPAGPADAQRFRDTFAKCGKSIEQLKSEMS